ncbi:MAG: hypothetical protein KKE02_22910 [Alphaproteobacteria bacterium]|nr:hypothetical protein [Alphaproteobacteria bacterium]MBU1516362.1 hypothetical protein [Alphaproteobacteria bacterium]MBU2093401.1 hypothetical protein [Alphaproteobacteria bacterium]MBU2153888.1 hypothetical protein [Alphaproteobacteria bacterium]MBU2307760.1 hypothetical protein [Alphaproteobacteria bacterium]
MAHDNELFLPTRYTPQEIWEIAVESVLGAAQKASHSAKPPMMVTPINRVLPNQQAAVRYLGVLQDLLARVHGLIVNFVENPPLSLADMLTKKFEDLVFAVEERLLALKV